MDTLVESISDFLWLSDRIATAGQPTTAQYPAIAAAGYQVVINLGLKDSPHALADEAEIASNLRLEYVHIPVAWNAPTLADFQIFSQVMEMYSHHKVFIHCAANKRVSVFMYLYQLHQGIDSMTARKDLAKIWVPNLIWQNFINSTQSSIRGN